MLTVFSLNLLYKASNIAITNTPNRIDFQSRAQLVSNSRFITPVIDCQRNSVITVENLINDDALGEEDTASGGNATARYITRRVTLKDGFDAASVQVFLTANRPPLSKILVYYKVLSQFDTALFDDRPWVLMDELSNTSSVSANTDDNEYLELEFCPRRVGNSTDIDYISDGVTYDSFKTFAIKIVMTSARTTRVPLVKDLRAIALA